LPILVFAGVFSLENLEERLGLHTVVALEYLLDPTPIVLIERIRAGTVRMIVADQYMGNPRSR
jgi:hypothetical protein